jgi:DNA polymerase elongation subunit (family B)
MNYITFDIETYSPESENSDNSSNLSYKIDTKTLRTSVIGAYISWIDKYLVFFEKEIPDFLAALHDADLVVGFNHLWFDLPVLQKYAGWDLSSLHSYDILLEVEKKVGYKIKLDDMAKTI